MKSVPLLLITLCLLAGCVSSRLAQLQKPEGRYVPAIDVAASIGFSGDRSAALRSIAAKSDISEAEQVYLLEVLQITAGFSGDTKDVLLALIGNRATTDVAKKRLSEMLPGLGLFSGDAKAVADALTG